MPAAAVPAIIGAVGGIGSALIGSGSKGKKTEYTSGRSPQATALENQYSNYISQGLGKPVAYANVNPMAIQAMDMISRMFMGQGYSQPSYGMSAPGGGPTGMGMPQQQYGMPSQTNPQMPQGMGQGMGRGGYQPPGTRQFYGGYNQA